MEKVLNGKLGFRAGKGCKLQEYLGSEMTKKTLIGLVSDQEEARLALGQSRALSLLILPVAKWEKAIASAYTGAGRPQELTVRDMRDQAKMADIVMNAVNEHLKLCVFGVIKLSGVDAVYLVPEIPYWRWRVGLGPEGDR